MVYNTKRIQYADLEGEKFHVKIPTLYAIEWDGVVYEILINQKSKCQKAVIFGTGAIIKDKPLPVFSRASWMYQMSYTGIWYFDPTVYMGDLLLGWGYGTNRRWYLKDIAHLLEIILEKMNIPKENTLFFGSSGGGFTSILLASMFGSRATAINPQLDINVYLPGPVERFQKVVLQPGEELIPQRICAATFIKENGCMPAIHLVENLFSTNDVQTQLRVFLEKLDKDRIDCSDMLRVELYSAKGGHNAMPSMEKTLQIIEEDMERPIPSPKPLFLTSEPVDAKISLDSKIEGDKLCVYATVNPVNEFTQYAYYLFKNNTDNVIVKQMYIKSHRFEFLLSEPGNYFVRVFARSKFNFEDDYTLTSAFTKHHSYPQE